MLDKSSKIYVAGHHGLVGSAIWNNLKARGYNNLVGRSHKELDLTDQVAVKAAVSVVSQLEEAGMSAKIISSPDELYDLQIVHENVGLQRAFSLMGESERLDDLATEDELKEEVMNMAVYAQVKMPIYFLCYLDKGVVVSSHLSGRLSPGECFVYMGAEYLK